MDLGLKGKTAIITGSTRGLGFAVAEELAKEGANVLVCGRNSKSVEAAKNKLKAYDVESLAINADISTPDGINHVLTMADAAFGKVDILCMSTGGPPPGGFADLEPADFTRSANDLLESLVQLVKGVVPGMQERGWGRVLAVTSISAAQPVDNLILSNTMRAGITGLMKSLANEYGKHGITFNCLMPGYTATERMTEVLTSLADSKGVSVKKAAANVAIDVPVGRIGRPDEFAALAAFLASERASYITGCSIPVDGGWIKGI